MLGLVLISWGAFAQLNPGNHNHGSHLESEDMDEPPNGGVLKKSGKYQVEMVVNRLLKEDKISFYLFNQNLKPLANKEVTGTVTYEFEDGSVIADTLQAKGSDRFVGQLRNTQSFICTVNFSIKGKEIVSFFAHDGLKTQASATYSCPMHPDITKDSPGECPKCGMNLKKK